MIPAAKERLNLSKAEKWAKERIPEIIPAKHDMAERIMKIDNQQYNNNSFAPQCDPLNISNDYGYFFDCSHALLES